MLLWVLRALLVVLLAGVSWAYVQRESALLGPSAVLVFIAVLVVGFVIVLADYVAPRKKLSILAGSFFGLVVGVLIAYALSFVVKLLVEQYAARIPSDQWLGDPSQRQAFIEFITITLGCISCYLSISFVMQTKDDFRFIVPYVEFARQVKGSRPLLLDTSVLIDGRIADVAATGVFETQLIVPQFVLNELQAIADSPDRGKRNRGRRGLDVVARLRQTAGVDVTIYHGRDDDKDLPVDQHLMSLARDLNARVLTTDFNLNKVAQLTGVDVMNVNQLANALKAEVLPGETLAVKLVRPGEESNQGVGFLDDGTMVVVEHGRGAIGQEVQIVVTNARQTSAGKMVFGRLSDGWNKPSDKRPNPTAA